LNAIDKLRIETRLWRIFISPFIVNNIGFSLVFRNLDNDLRHIYLLITLNVLF
jgi:hypothetical protein